MDKNQVTESKPNASFFTWLLKILKLPLVIYKFLFYKEVRQSLSGKVVLITGASSGLGEALCHVFYSAGAKVILAARRVEELERVKSDLLLTHSTTETSHPPVILKLDLTDLNELPNKVKEVLDIFGHIDILVNNGGISVRSEAIKTKIDVDIKIMLTNYFGTVALTKSVLPSMIERKQGRILCISSVQGKIAIPHRAAYSASKHALQAFCDSLRAEVDEHNIKVTLISPGYISTNFSLNALTGNGNLYGKMDATTEHGTDPLVMAKDILQAVLRDKKDVIICSLAPKLAYWLRFICPSLYFFIMSKRARKLSKQNNSSFNKED
ncbi:hypothetical protein PVAND_005126 [Polypedilum vanderplanki]|uniref:Dehydrogenase/reductase SDR family protein 7-like n=1 Tax=Polypedilum vanderplanki TaxID=319348 RepID=A0A9J6BZN3_POLVA|nr:hypothetical protein PVAND_005126 [Polypedilum vanderplanki]